MRAGLAAVVNEHASHFALHHDGITWCVRDLRDVRVESSQVRRDNLGHLQRVDAALAEHLNTELGIKQRVLDFKYDRVPKRQMALSKAFDALTSMIQSINILEDRKVFITGNND